MRVHFERIEDSRRKAQDVAKAATTFASEPLNVGIMCTIGPRRFSRFLDTFRNEHPAVAVTLHDATASVVPELLLGGGLDCVFCVRAEKHDQRFEVVELFSEGVVVVFAQGHRFEAFEAVGLEEIAKEAYIDRLHCEFRDEFLAFTKSSGLELDVAIRSEREDWILEFLHSGLGVRVMPASSVIPETVACRSIKGITASRKLELVMTVNATVSPNLSAFRGAAKAFDWQQPIAN
jgi:LysR family hydrogen peroxide-inducible transcriptional activator